MQSCGTVCGPRTFAAALLSKRLPHICMLRDGMRQTAAALDRSISARVLRDGMRQTAAALDRSISRAAPTIQGPSSSFFFFIIIIMGVLMYRFSVVRIVEFRTPTASSYSLRASSVTLSRIPCGPRGIDHRWAGGRPAGFERSKLRFVDLGAHARPHSFADAASPAQGDRGAEKSSGKTRVAGSKSLIPADLVASTPSWQA